MPDYSIFVMAESDISLTGGVVLDGVSQGDGSHLVTDPPTFLTINTTTTTEIFVTDNETTFDDNDGNQTLNGTQSFGGATFSNGTGIEAEYQFVVEDPSGNQYTLFAINFNNSNPTFGTVEGIAFVGTLPPVGVPLQIISASEGPGSGSQTAVDETLLIPYCLTKGTLVMTEIGQRPIEDLVPGDRIARVAGGYASLRRVMTSQYSAKDMARNDKLCPVRITVGALGCGLPARDLLVSRQHRMLVSSRIAQRMFGQPDVLIAAIKLTELPGIFIDHDVDGVTYFHLLFDRHEAIFAEGAPTESLYAGPEAMKGLGEEAREEMYLIFPELRTTSISPEPAHLIPPARRQKKLIERHARHARPLLETQPCLGRLGQPVGGMPGDGVAIGYSRQKDA